MLFYSRMHESTNHYHSICSNIYGVSAMLSHFILTYSFFLWDGSQVSFGDDGCGFLYHVHDSGTLRLACVYVCVWVSMHVKG